MENPFNSSAMAAGYAIARPPVHPRVMELARPALQRLGRIERALDLGCGAGISTRALIPFADQVFGLEPVEAMLAWRHSTAPSARFAAGAAEMLPFRTGAFDLIAAAGSLNFVQLPQFFEEARRVLKASGMLLVYDYSHGRNFRSDDTLDSWFSEFLERYPATASKAIRLDPEILRYLDSGFQVCDYDNFEIGITLEPEFYLEYVLTCTNIAAAIGAGIPESEVRAWCAETLAPVWLGRAREVIFRGYFACLQL